MTTLLFASNPFPFLVNAYHFCFITLCCSGDEFYSISIIVNVFTLCAGEEMHIPILGVMAFGQRYNPSFYKFLPGLVAR